MKNKPHQTVLWSSKDYWKSIVAHSTDPSGTPRSSPSPGTDFRVGLYVSSRTTVFANLKENAAPFPNVNSKWWYTKERLNLWELQQQPTLESPRSKNVLQAEVKNSDRDFTPQMPQALTWCQNLCYVLSFADCWTKLLHQIKRRDQMQNFRIPLCVAAILKFTSGY